MVFITQSLTGTFRMASATVQESEHPMPNRYVTLARDTTSTNEGSYLGRILCPNCMCAHSIAAEGGCSTEVCDDCGSPSESE